MTLTTPHIYAKSFIRDGGKPAKESGKNIEPAIVDPTLIELAKTLSAHLRLGTSSWNYPGWDGLVWNGEYAETNLSRYGLAAYAQLLLFSSIAKSQQDYYPSFHYPQPQYVGILSHQMDFVAAAQQNSQWCWAAAI